jgi:transcriptional regulator with XRE-family HTH domain
VNRQIQETTRDRHLTEEEEAKYRRIRELVAEELPDLRARAKARLRELHEATEVFAELRKVREAQGLSLAHVQRLTGIDRSALSKLERGERVNFTVGTLTRYAAAVGKHVLFQLTDATEALQGSRYLPRCWPADAVTRKAQSPDRLVLHPWFRRVTLPMNSEEPQGRLCRLIWEACPSDCGVPRRVRFAPARPLLNRW